MLLVGKIELKTIGLSDALEFTVSREEGAAERIAFPIFAFLVLLWFWSIGSVWPRILAGCAAIASAAAFLTNWIQGGETTLRVTTDGLIAHGNLGHLFFVHEEVGVGELSSISYMPGGEGEISGLYARLNWRAVMLLPHISNDQANKIIDAIRRKFPWMPAEYYTPYALSDLLPFGRGDQISTLGLSEPDEKQKVEPNQDTPS